MNLKAFLTPAAALLTLAMTSGTSFGRDRGKVTVYRDRDGDGHYNKKTYDVGRRSGYYHGGHGYYGYGYRGYRPSYGYRPYGYGYGYGYPSYYGPSYYGPSIGLSFSSRPTYSSRVYRGYDYSSSLAAEVQSALRRNGYYYGAVDGDIGPASRSAILRYQRSRGLAATGRIDAALLRSLRIN